MQKTLNLHTTAKINAIGEGTDQLRTGQKLFNFTLDQIVWSMLQFLISKDCLMHVYIPMDMQNYNGN